MLAWLAGETWKLKAYRDFDNGLGYDMYVLTYAKTFNVKPESVTKSQRQLGKVLELALGYGGGVGAFLTFANGYHVDLNEIESNLRGQIPAEVYQGSENFYEKCVKDKKTYGLSKDVFIACDSIKRMWRAANAMIESLWKTLEYDCTTSIVRGGAVERERYITDKKGTWLRIKLPSGRYLCYAGAKVSACKISYLGVNHYSRKWGRLATYGGKLAENLTQAASRDVLAYGMCLAEDLRYHVVLSVHDELITETPDTPEFNSEALSKIMSTVPPWAMGLPLAAAGFEAKRYRKD
jgi:DNA polymerase